ncbi:hypothetical protein EVAR_78516_1 [Eumeta japonica]|uniref:Uncharacterized protein n=1 Tax=Eumeta variegata TaxID=151549 RepID=A0A4C1TZL1_EUMVA|nr:hypothetical protein EVAR_78516_1 [Eumeta japonica]
MFLNYFKETQKDVPFALGGCLIDDTLRDPKDLLQLVNSDGEDRPFLTDDTVSIAVFSVAKDAGLEENGLKNSFEAYSLIIEASDWSKIRIQKTVNEFAEKVPRFEYSAALKLSCVGRDLRHEVEQDIFRAAFPDTPIAGCYGNGEIGHNHPSRFDPPDSNDIAKSGGATPLVDVGDIRNAVSVKYDLTYAGRGAAWAAYTQEARVSSEEHPEVLYMFGVRLAARREYLRRFPDRRTHLYWNVSTSSRNWTRAKATYDSGRLRVCAPNEEDEVIRHFARDPRLSTNDVANRLGISQ